VVCHETRSRTENRQVAPALLHELELVCLDRLADFVVGNLRRRDLALLQDLYAGDLLVAPVVQRFRYGCNARGVMIIDALLF
jgi:hypothetical protein